MIAFFPCFLEWKNSLTETGECFDAECCKTTVLKDGISDGSQS